MNARSGLEPQRTVGEGVRWRALLDLCAMVAGAAVIVLCLASAASPAAAPSLSP